MASHDIERSEDILVVRLHNSLTHRSSDHFHDVLAVLEDSPVRRCDVHLDRLDFIDSQGLGLLLTAGRLAESRQVAMRLVGPRGEVKELVEFARLGNVVEIAY